MIGNVGLFVDRRLAFWLSAVYLTRSLLDGSTEEDSADGSQAVFAAILDEMDFEEKANVHQFN